MRHHEKEGEEKISMRWKQTIRLPVKKKRGRGESISRTAEGLARGKKKGRNEPTRMKGKSTNSTISKIKSGKSLPSWASTGGKKKDDLALEGERS